MAKNLSESDRETLQQLRDFGVLADVNPALINLQQGICITPCGDGDHFGDIYHYHENLLLRKGLPLRIHVLSSHGGALLIPPESPLNKNNRGDNLLEDIGNVPVLKGITTLSLYAHAPCGAAGLANLSALRQISLLKKADIIIQERFPALQALCFFQVYWGENKDRTYFVLGEKWREWLQKNPNAAL